MIRPCKFLIIFLDDAGRYHHLTESSYAVCGKTPDHIWIFGKPETAEEKELYMTVYPIASCYGNRITHINTDDFSKDHCR